jgi:hypothetical protein
MTSKGTFLLSLDEIGLALNEEMLLKEKRLWTDDGQMDAGRKAITKAHHVSL